jgi:hypothetical protein
MRPKWRTLLDAVAKYLGNLNRAERRWGRSACGIVRGPAGQGAIAPSVLEFSIEEASAKIHRGPRK